MRSFQDHLDQTWYKNKQSLRNFDAVSADWDFDDRVPPRHVASIVFPERVWSVPSRITERTMVMGCWDNAVHCICLDRLTRAWRLETSGPVYSSPAVLRDGRFVIGCEDHRLRLVGPDGRCLWSFVAEGAFHATATVDEAAGIVFAGNYDHRMYALDLETGALRWYRCYDSAVEDDIYSSPALSDRGTIIFGTNDALVCLDRDGRELWRTTAGGRFEGTAALDYALGIGVVGTEIGGRVRVFEIASGAILAEHATGGHVVSCPSLSRTGLAYVGSNDGHVYGIDLATGALRWKRHVGCEFRYTPFTTLPSGNALFTGVDETVHCLSAEDGAPLWALTIAGGCHSSPLITSRGDLVVGSHRNAVHVFRWPS